MVDGKSITDEQIRSVLEHAKANKLRGTVAVCRIALDDCVTHKSATQIAEARERVAEAYNRLTFR